MTAEPSPRPWRVIPALEDEPARVMDANGEDVAIELTEADAALIVDAVNERDRLRDLVKRLAEFVNDTACFTPSDKEVAQSLLREARAAIGEDAP